MEEDDKEQWEQLSVPVTDVVPQYEDQERHLIWLLCNTNSIKGVSFNTKESGEYAIDTNSAIFNEFPLLEGESLLEYSKRTLGEVNSLSDEQKRARDILSNERMNIELEGYHSYKYNIPTGQQRTLSLFHWNKSNQVHRRNDKESIPSFYNEKRRRQEEEE